MSFVGMRKMRAGNFSVAAVVSSALREAIATGCSNRLEALFNDEERASTRRYVSL
jgi:hypothetical protein